jgi:hypothetical protein
VDGLVVLRRWGSQEILVVTLVEPELVVEVGVDVARDASGRWRYPARWHRACLDLSLTDIPHQSACSLGIHPAILTAISKPCPAHRITFLQHDQMRVAVCCDVSGVNPLET